MRANADRIMQTDSVSIVLSLTGLGLQFEG